MWTYTALKSTRTVLEINLWANCNWIVKVDQRIRRKNSAITFGQLTGFCKNPVTFLILNNQLKLNIVKNFAQFNNCHCITETIYIDKKLMNDKYRLIEAKILEISTLLSMGFKKINCDFKAAERQQKEQRLKACESHQRIVIDLERLRV